MNSYEIEYSRYDRKKGLVIPKNLTPELAYLCGVIAGDGSITFDLNEQRYCLEICGNPKDEKEFYHNVIIPYFKRVFNLNPEARYFDGNTTYGVIIFSKVLILYFIRELGLPYGKKYSKLKIPEFFLKDRTLLLPFIRGVFDTDGCICFKRKYRYPTIVLSSASSKFILEISNVLKKGGLSFYEVYDYKVYDPRFKKGYNLISRIEINGKNNFERYMDIVGFSSPKHLNKIRINENK